MFKKILTVVLDLCQKKAPISVIAIGFYRQAFLSLVPNLAFTQQASWVS